jgi:hypothetical protein
VGPLQKMPNIHVLRKWKIMWIKWKTFIITNRKITNHEVAKMFESFIWVSLQHLERQSEHVFNCCLACWVRSRKIKQTSAWASSKGLKETQNSCQRSSRGTSCGCMDLTEKPSKSSHWKNPPSPLVEEAVGWGKQVPSSVMIMFIVCMTFMELCITNLYHKHKL